MNRRNLRVGLFGAGTRGGLLSLAKVKRLTSRMFPDLHMNGNCPFRYLGYDARVADDHVQAHDEDNLDGLARNEIVPTDALSVAQMQDILRQCPHTRDVAEQLVGFTGHTTVDGGMAEPAVGKAFYLVHRQRLRSRIGEMIHALIPATILGHEGAEDTETTLQLRLIFMGQGFQAMGTSGLQLLPLDVHDLLRHRRIRYETIAIITAPSPSDQDKRHHLNYRTTMESFDQATADPTSVRVGTLQGEITAHRRPYDRIYLIDGQSAEGEHLDNDAQIAAIAQCAVSQALDSDEANGAFHDASVLPGNDKRPFCSWGTWGLVYHREQAQLRLELMIREILMQRLVRGGVS